MNDLSVVTAFLGWCSVINIAILFYATIVIAFWRDFAKQLHAKIFNVPEESLDVIYFKYLAYYKLLILVFNLVPYLVLRIVL